MTIPLTRETLQAAWDYLCTTPPMSRWNLPAAEDLTFKVVRSRSHAGWYERAGNKHTIAISSSCVGHTESLMATLAHEAIHYYMAITGMDRGTGEHGGAFHKLAKQVCRVHGFDPQAF